MRTIGRWWQHIIFPGVATFFTVAVAVAVGAGQSQSLSQEFEARYQQLLQQVEAGQLSPRLKDEAKAVWIALRKEIIALDAEMETLKLEVMSEQGARQKAALDELGATAGERERRLMRAIQDLDRLAGREISAIPLAPAAPAVGISDETSGHRSNDKEKQEEEFEHTKTQTWDIEIEFAPEDLSKGDME